jgi:MFS family permease
LEQLLRDRRLLYVAAFLRAFATGALGVLLGLHLDHVGLSFAAIGGVVAAGLSGAAFAALVVIFAGDRVGRRVTLVALATLGAAGTLVVAIASDPAAIGLAALVGMLNGMGRDRGAALVIDQAILPATTTPATRTTAFAWYNVLQDAGHALGALAAGVPQLLVGALAINEQIATRDALFGCAAISLITAVAYLGLSPAIELPSRTTPTPPLAAATRRALWKISALFALDGIGGGFLSAALVSVFFTERFGVGAASLGLLYFAARLANAGSHLAAAWLAKRIGLVNTMVFTHLPSSLLLVTVAFAPSWPIAAALFLLREGLVEMDVPTRQSYVMALVAPEERTRASGITHLVRLGAWAIAPTIAGLIMGGGALSGPLYLGAALKITYDILLYVAFRAHRAPEEA